MSEADAHHSRDAPAWPLRAIALLLVVIGVFPLADYLGVAEPQQWWRHAWYAWALWAPVIAGLALLLARDNTQAWATRAEGWRRALLSLSPRWFALLVGVLTCGLSLLIGRVMFHSEPVTIDELSQLWQAHLLASGHLYAIAEPRPEFFSTMQTVSWHGHWFSHFPLGGPLVQAAGLLLGVPWLVNPLLAGCAAAAVYRFAAAIGDESEARGAALLVATSPFVLIIAGSWLDHAATLVAVWVAMATLPGWLAATSLAAATRRAAVIGAALGCAAMLRPYDGAVASLAIGGFQLWHARRGGVLARSLLVQALAGAVPLALLLGYNAALTGRPLTFAYDVLNGPDHRPGFHMSPLGYVHTPLTGLYRISSYAMRLNAAMLGWPVPAVAIAALAMLAWRRVSQWDLLLALYLLLTLAAYAWYWGDGSFHGPRFLYQVVPVFLLWVARFPAAMRQHLRAPVLRSAVLLLIPLWLFVAWLIPSPRLQPFGAWGLTFGSREPEYMTTVLTEAVHRRHLHNALVFVEDGWHARLTSRMRSLGISPFTAQLIVGNFNACSLQQRLDDAEHRRLSGNETIALITSIMQEPLDSRPVPGLSALEQLALPRSTMVPSHCKWDFEHALGRGIDLARLLPLMPLDSVGRLDGNVVYARDFGARNELLRDRFPDRTWFTARADVVGDSIAIVIEPYVRPARLSLDGR